MADKPASKETVVEDSDQKEVDIEPVESSIQSTAEVMKVVADLQRFTSSKLKDDYMVFFFTIWSVTDSMQISQRLPDLQRNNSASLQSFFHSE